MLFGGGKQEQVNLGELEAYLNSAFNGKLKNLESRASGVVRELDRARLQFIEAARGFEQLTAEPETENIYIHDSGVIKSQKVFYSTALKRVLEDWKLSVYDAPNIYEKYSSTLSHTQRFIAELAKVNTNFRKVLRSYPHYLESFKKPYSLIERYTDSLKNELSKSERERSEYNNINDRMIKLGIFLEELENLRNGIGALNESKGPARENAIETNEMEISNNIASRELELTGLNAQISGLAARINSVAIPLERPSRKFDHTSGRKKQLSPFITDPINSIKSESDYAEFLELLGELKKSLGSGSIDLKNNLKTEQAISELLNSDIHKMILDLKSLQGKKADLQKEIDLSRGIMYRLEHDRQDSQKTIKDMETMKSSAAEMESKIKYTKTAIEGLFLEYYSRKLSLLLPD